MRLAGSVTVDMMKSPVRVCLSFQRVGQPAASSFREG
jgi:hypothetical protein